jgi:hypothetical protein
MHRRLFWALPLALGAAACGSDDGGTTPTGTQTDPNTLTFTTPKFEVPPGDSFTCFYTDIVTDRELSVIGGNGIQGPGGHHIVAYYAVEPRDVGYHPCADSEMVNLRQIAGGAEQSADQNGILALPEGLGLFVPKGKQIVMQAHYINTTGASYEVQDEAILRTTDPANIKAYVNYHVTNDDAFEVPPSSPYERTTLCKLTRDYQIALALGHMHELGKHYKLELLDDKGELVDTIIDDEVGLTYSSHPPVQRWEMDSPLMLKAGQTLRQTCKWDNTTAKAVTFPREMCLSFVYYWPGDGDLDCAMEEEPATK